MRLKTALSIAGSDSSGGAGIQADLKTMTCNGVFAMSAITALTAQNTTGVTGIYEVSPDFLGQQIDAVFTDIYPDAVKIGMVSSAPLIHVIAQRLADYDAPQHRGRPRHGRHQRGQAPGRRRHRDPLHRAAPAGRPSPPPTWPEAEILSDQTIDERGRHGRSAAETIGRRYHCAVLCKGGHKVGGADDLLWHRQRDPLVPRRAHRQPQHPRDRLHPVQRHRRRIWPRGWP